MARHLVFVVALIGALGTATPAQLLSTQANPQPALVGVPITVVVTDAVGTGFTINGSSCFGTPIRSERPDGPAIYTPAFCTDDLLGIPPQGSFTINWNQVDDHGRQVPPGNYWMRLAAIGIEEWVCVTIQHPDQGRHLSALGPAVLGQDLVLRLSDPDAGGGAYAVLASGSAGGGVDLGALGYLCLDPDLLFSLSFPAPPASIFENFLGSLDQNGVAGEIAVHIPAEPFLAQRPLHFQAAVLSVSGSFAFTNVLNLKIQPPPVE
jgi:hypothetical protein